MQDRMALLIAYRRLASIDGEECLCKRYSLEGEERSLAPDEKREEAISEKAQSPQS